MKNICQFEFKEIGPNEINSNANELTEKPGIIQAIVGMYYPPFPSAVSSGLPPSPQEPPSSCSATSRFTVLASPRNNTAVEDTEAHVLYNQCSLLQGPNCSLLKRH